MNSWMSPDGILAVVGVLTIVGGFISAYLGVLIWAGKETLRAQDDKIKNIVIEKSSIEARLIIIEKETITRSEMLTLERKMTDAIKDVGDRVTKSLDGLGSRVEHLLERVAKVEAKKTEAEF